MIARNVRSGADIANARTRPRNGSIPVAVYFWVGRFMGNRQNRTEGIYAISNGYFV